MGFFDSLFGGGSKIDKFALNPRVEQNMTGAADQIAATERNRYESGLGVATGAFEQAQAALGEQVNPDLLFGQASDQIGARGRAGLESIRSSLGSRGLSANSGAAQGMLSRLIFQQQGNITGAKRDIALTNQKERQVNAALNFANALNLSGYINSPASGIQYENWLNLYQGELAKQGLNTQIDIANQANESDPLGTLLDVAGVFI